MDLRSESDASELWNILPKDCISHILSFTSPKNACVSAAVSYDWWVAADSDIVWARFLPSNYHDILSRAVAPIQFSSKKDLFLCLCNPVLIDGGQSSISLEKTTGKICYMISSEQLEDNKHKFWTWSTLPESRFENVAGPMNW